jgi:hypothetical protein
MVKERYHVTYDSTNGNAFVVHKGNGTSRTFQQSPRGLFYMDTATTGTLLMSTVAENKTSYINHDYSKAVLAREIQKKIGQPSTRAFLKVVDNKLLPITVQSRVKTSLPLNTSLDQMWVR